MKGVLVSVEIALAVIGVTLLGYAGYVWWSAGEFQSRERAAIHEGMAARTST